MRASAPGAFAAQPAVGVGRSGRADVIPLAVENHQQAAFVGVADDPAQHDHAGRTEFLEKGRLRLDGRHALGDHVDDFTAKLVIGGGDFLRVSRIFRRKKSAGQHVGPGIESHEHGVAAAHDRLIQSIGKCKHDGNRLAIAQALA